MRTLPLALKLMRHVINRSRTRIRVSILTKRRTTHTSATVRILPMLHKHLHRLTTRRIRHTFSRTLIHNILCRHRVLVTAGASSSIVVPMRPLRHLHRFAGPGVTRFVTMHVISLLRVISIGRGRGDLIIFLRIHRVVLGLLTTNTLTPRVNRAVILHLMTNLLVNIVLQASFLIRFSNISRRHRLSKGHSHSNLRHRSMVRGLGSNYRGQRRRRQRQHSRRQSTRIFTIFSSRRRGRHRLCRARCLQSDRR